MNEIGSYIDKNREDLDLELLLEEARNIHPNNRASIRKSRSWGSFIYKEHYGDIIS